MSTEELPTTEAISAATAPPAVQEKDLTILAKETDNVEKKQSLLSGSKVFCLTEEEENDQDDDDVELDTAVPSKPSVYNDFVGISAEESISMGNRNSHVLIAKMQAFGNVTPSSFNKDDIRRYNTRPDVPTVSDVIEIKQKSDDAKSLFAKSKILKDEYITQFAVDLLYDPFICAVIDVHDKSIVTGAKQIKKLSSLIITNGTNWPQAGGLTFLTDHKRANDLAFAGSISNNSILSAQLHPLFTAFVDEALTLITAGGLLTNEADIARFKALVIKLQVDYIRLVGPHVNAKKVSSSNIPIWMLIASKDIEPGQEICRAVALPTLLRHYSLIVARATKHFLDLPAVTQEIQQIVDA